MKPIHLVVLVLAAVAIMLGVTFMQKQQAKNAPAPAAATSGPPAGARFVEAEAAPLDVISSGSAYVGMWIKEPGWQVAINDITEEKEGLALRIEVAQPTALRGSAYIVAIVPEDTDIKKNEFCFISGRIDSVSEFTDGGPVPGHRLILRDVKITKNLGP